MPPIDLPTRFGTVSYRIGLRHASFVRYCLLFNINIGGEFNKDKHMSLELASHLFKYETFSRLYESDYYRDKTPEYIATLLDKKLNEVLDAIRIIAPTYFENNIFKAREQYSLRYISSFEIDKLLGGNYQFLEFE